LTGGEGCSLRTDYDGADPAIGATSFDDCTGDGEWSFLAVDHWITETSSAALAGTRAIVFSSAAAGMITKAADFRVMPGHGYCQDTNGREGTARYFPACASLQQCEQLCQADDGPGLPGAVKRQSCSPQQIVFVRRFCMGAQGA
jgi:hypothetical protein